MARVNTNSKKPQQSKNKTKKEVKRSNLVVQEESPKGEAFFKIVLWLMFAALLAAATWLIVQTIIDNNNKVTKPFESEMYLTLDELKLIDGDDAYKTSDALSDNVKKAFSASKGLDVYIYFYDSSLTDGKEAHQKTSSEVIKALWKNVKKETTKDDNDNEVNFYYFEEGFTILFFDFAGVDYSLTNFLEDSEQTSPSYPFLGQILKGSDARTLFKGKYAVNELNKLADK